MAERLTGAVARIRLASTEERLARIAEFHHKWVDEHGGTLGECSECSLNWPCPTYVWATSERDLTACWDPADDEVD